MKSEKVGIQNRISNFINSKKREVFNVVHPWARHVKCIWYVELVQIFFSRKGGNVEAHLMKVLPYQKHYFITVKTRKKN